MNVSFLNLSGSWVIAAKVKMHGTTSYFITPAQRSRSEAWDKLFSLITE